MTNTPYGVAAKAATLVPIVAAVYYYDWGGWLAALESQELLRFFILAFTLFGLGVLTKRRIIGAALELSRTSFVWGLLLLVIAASLYLCGSYLSGASWYRYESLLFLVFSYAAFRVGQKVLRALAPLLGAVALSFVPLGVFPFLSAQELVIVTASASLALLTVYYSRLGIRSLLLPVAVVGIAAASWFYPTIDLPSIQVYTGYLIPLPLLALVSKSVRRFTLPPKYQPAYKCTLHRVSEEGFCSICGMKAAAARRQENLGIWGLFAVIAVGALLLFASVPVLAVTGGVAYDAHYGSQGFSGTVTPPTPNGWQVNSTTYYHYNASEVYAVKQVVVPISHPEVKNYTLYYEVSEGVPVSDIPSGDIPGWSRLSNDFMQFGDFNGHITAYGGANRTMLVYSGTTGMEFLTSSGFKSYTVGVGFVREFKNSNVTADTAQLQGDINSLWLGGFTNDRFYSSWTTFLLDTYLGGLYLIPLVSLAFSVFGMGWVAYRARLADQRLDRFCSVASTLGEDGWQYVSRLLGMPGATGTGSEAGDSQLSEGDTEEAADSLGVLEKLRLVRRVFVDRGGDTIMLWSACV